MLANVPTFSFPVACVACCDCSVIAVERNEMKAATSPESRKHGHCLQIKPQNKINSFSKKN